MSRLRSPIWWFGGKGNMLGRLLPIIESIPHRIYVEPFGGGASILIAKQPSPVDVYNDLDSGLVNFFRVLRDPEQFERFCRLVSLTPYSREEYYRCLENWQELDDPVERAWAWFIAARQSFGGRFTQGWGFNVSSSCRGMAQSTSAWLSTIDMLPEIHQRLMRVQIEHRDWEFILDTYDTPETLFYLDPPYIPDTRRNGGYKHELTLEDHERLVSRLLTIQGQAVLSGYTHPVYEPLEAAGWERVDFPTVCYAAGCTRGTGIRGVGTAKAKQPRTESVWIKRRDTRAVLALPLAGEKAG